MYRLKLATFQEKQVMKTATIGLAEAKNKLTELIDRVANGEEITITRHDQAIARLVPARRLSYAEAGRVVEALRTLRARNPVALTTQEILAMKNAGQ
jgi:prevent-host-death family protein